MEHGKRKLKQNGTVFEGGFSICSTLKFFSLSCVPAFPAKSLIFVLARFFSWRTLHPKLIGLGLGSFRE
jgi:hypothetical protein